MLSRRHFLTAGMAAGGALAARAWLRGPVYAQTSDASRPAVPWGVQSGDVTPSTAVIWSATDRPARMLVEYSMDERFGNARRLVGPAALPDRATRRRSSSSICRQVATSSTASSSRTSPTSRP